MDAAKVKFVREQKKAKCSNWSPVNVWGIVIPPNMTFLVSQNTLSTIQKHQNSWIKDGTLKTEVKITKDVVYIAPLVW